MPKKSRQAHIPQQVRRRKARRPNIAAIPEAEERNEEFVEGPVASDALVAVGGLAPVEARPRRRLESVTRQREATGVRAQVGQLPTYDRAYLTDELRRIAIITGSLLALIVFLTLVLR